LGLEGGDSSFELFALVHLLCTPDQVGTAAGQDAPKTILRVTQHQRDLDPFAHGLEHMARAQRHARATAGTRFPVYDDVEHGSSLQCQITL